MPRGVDHVILRVSSLEKSLPYYRLVYGAAAERPRDSNGRVWFHLERNTRLGLEEAPPGLTPAIAHYAGALTLPRLDAIAHLAQLYVVHDRPQTHAIRKAVAGAPGVGLCCQ